MALGEFPDGILVSKWTRPFLETRVATALDQIFAPSSWGLAGSFDRFAPLFQTNSILGFA